MSLSFLGGYLLGNRDAATSALRAAAIPARGSVSSDDLLDLDERVDRLLLVVTAMATLLEEAGVIGGEQIAATVRELDEADGTADGKTNAVCIDMCLV